MTKNPLTRDVQVKLREFLRSPEGMSFMGAMYREEPVPVQKDDHPIETMALSGAMSQGWKRCLRRMLELSEPDITN